MRISKKVREEAAFCCQAAASTVWTRMESWRLPLDCQSYEQFSWSQEAADLAHSAWSYARQAVGQEYSWGAEPWAEAEAMLRTGWVPDGQ